MRVEFHLYLRSQSSGKVCFLSSYPWCDDCPADCGTERNRLHLYLYASNTHVKSITLVLGVFRTGFPWLWGDWLVQARSTNGHAPRKTFDFGRISSSRICGQTALARTIITQLAAKGKFLARALVVPYPDEGAPLFANSTTRLDFFLWKFIRAYLRFGVQPGLETVFVISSGGHSAALVPALRKYLARISSPTIIAEHPRDKCLLLQVSNLIAGCAKQIVEPGAHPQKLAIADSFSKQFAVDSKRFGLIGWNWKQKRFYRISPSR